MLKGDDGDGSVEYKMTVWEANSWCGEITTTRRQDRSIFSSSLITEQRTGLTTGISHSQDVRSGSVSLTDVFFPRY